MSQREILGLWWLPGAEEQAQPGVLSWAEGRAPELQLIGSFTALTELPRTRKRPLILGLPASGDPLTLVQCTNAGFRVGMPGLHTEKYRSIWAIEGAHLSTEEELRFSELDFSLAGLLDWLGRTSLHPLDSPTPSTRAGIARQRPEALKLEGNDFSLKLAVDGYVDGRDPGWRLFDEWGWFEIQPRTPLDFGTLQRRFLRPLQNFVSFATLRVASVIEIDLYHPDVKYASINEQKPLKVLSGSTSGRNVHNDELWRSDVDMLFSLADVPVPFEYMMARWLQCVADFGDAIGLFFTSDYVPGQYVNNQFLFMALAAEAYHRARFDNEVLQPEEHERRVAEVLAAIPEGHAAWARDRLAYHGNEPAFPQRLRDLINKAGSWLSPLVGDKSGFVGRVSAARNFIAHHDPASRNAVADPTKVFHLAETLAWLLRACWLQDLGFSPEQAGAIVQRNGVFQIACSRTGRKRARES